MIITQQKRLEILIAARLLKVAVRTEAGADTTRDAEIARLDAAIADAKAAREDGKDGTR